MNKYFAEWKSCFYLHNLNSYVIVKNLQGLLICLKIYFVLITLVSAIANNSCETVKTTVTVVFITTVRKQCKIISAY